MAPPTLVPSKDVLTRWQREGLTQVQMVERHERETGVRVTRAAIASAMVRYGLSEEKPRYSETLPWKVKTDHLTEYPARMLRLLGRRQIGGELNASEDQRLDSWLAMLKRERAVVGYDPDSAEGFHYIDAALKDHRGKAPIRKARIYTRA